MCIERTNVWRGGTATPGTQGSHCDLDSGMASKTEDIKGGWWEGVFTSESASGLVQDTL